MPAAELERQRLSAGVERLGRLGNPNYFEATWQPQIRPAETTTFLSGTSAAFFLQIFIAFSISTCSRRSSRSGRSFTRKSLFRWGPAQCFYQDDLYTLKLGTWSTDAIEHEFFGPIDARGQSAVGFFADYTMADAATARLRTSCRIWTLSV
jgi:hypothetical protein